MEINFVKT